MNLIELINYSNKYNNFDIIYSKFKKQLNYLIHSFNLEIYQNDLLLFLWQLIKKIDCNNFKSEKAIYSYINISLKHCCINFYKKNLKENYILYDSDITNLQIEKNNLSNNFYESNLIFNDLISYLPEKQQKIIYLRYKECLSDSQIASLLNISRQAVHKSRTYALNKLHNIYISNI